MTYQPADPSLDREYDELVAHARVESDLGPIEVRANELALKIRSRCMDLATWQAEYSSEYTRRVGQCHVLTQYAGAAAHPFLIREFGNVR